MLVSLLAAALAVLVLAPVAGANGVPLSNGDVLAATGNGQVKHFDPSGNLLDTLDTTTGSSYTTGMCFDSSQNLYVTDFSSTISEFDSGGNLLAATFASAPTTAESCVADASNNFYVGGPGAPSIYKFNSSGALVNTYSVAGGSGTGGTDWVDLASDQCTILYTGEGSEILSYNVCTNTQNPDFATGLPGPCYELRIRPNGEVMVACASGAVRLNSSGTVIQTYPITGSSQLFAMNLDPDGTTFWTGDIGNGEVSHVDIATGNILSQFNSAPSTQLAGLSIVGGIVVSQPTLVLSPLTTTQNVGTSDTVTATITNPGGSLSGQTVNFSVSGANTATGTGTTNGSGQATFSYTGTNAGGDTVTGSFTNAHGTKATGMASVTWTGVIGPPTATITTPPNNAIYTQSQVVDASYSCTEATGGPGIATCVGPVANGSPIDTSTTGPHSFTVTATSQDGQTGTATSMYTVNATATDPAIRDVKGLAVHALENSKDVQKVATFTDPDPNGAASDYTASINWGDGSTTVGTVTKSGRLFTVSGVHGYHPAGTYKITVTITDADGPPEPGATSTATITARGHHEGTQRHVTKLHAGARRHHKARHQH